MMCSIALISWCFSMFDTEQNLSPFCWTSDSMLPVFNSMTLIITITASVSSVILYVIVFVVSRKHANRLRGIQKDQQQYSKTFERQQRQLTITMGISCVFTLILYVLPVCAKFILADQIETEISKAVQAYAAISCNLTPLTNIAIVVLRHREILRRLIHVLPFSIEKKFFNVSIVPTAATTNCGFRSIAGKCTT
ncbi:hypothetical protein Tcan_11810 [Toxocara canis]|uniref:G-protein coupled receptors family 1 profile domain-containing protein n=1 Tax=Toxocara canis TaxID=6265 RepID=A0A0B2VE25_TOXCA|nr:hypothetical protein Tcan_11810 [Toxocara canis]